MIKIRSFWIVLLFVTFISTACKTEHLTPGQTPNPTRTPMPTIPKTPGVLDCSDIVEAHKKSTVLGWETTKTLLRGSEIYYTGVVNSVTETDIVHMTGSLCHATLHHVPHEIAINLSRGQQIDGYGTIKNIDYESGEDIDIDVNPDLLFVR